MNNHWPFHLEIRPDETAEACFARGTQAIKNMAGTDGIAAILDMLEGMSSDYLHQANLIALETRGDVDAYRIHAAGAKALREAARKLQMLVSSQDEPQEAVDRRARERLDYRRRRASGRALSAK